MDAYQNLHVPSYIRDDNLSEECKNLISSLPKDKDLMGITLCNYKGFWYYPNTLQAILDVEKNFRPRDTDIIVASFPKSGTTWLKALVFALVQRGKYRANPKGHPLLHENPHDLVPFVDIDLYYNGQIPDLTKFPNHSLFGTHMPMSLLLETVKGVSCKIVYICRNMKDVMVSNWRFRGMLHHKDMHGDTLDAMFDSYRRGVHFYGPFWDNVLGYWKQSLENPKQVLFMRYEEIKENPKAQLKRLAEFLGCPFSEEEEESGTMDEILELCSLRNLRDLEANRHGKKTRFDADCSVFFRKGEAGDWKNHLTHDMGRELDEIVKEKLQGSGLKF
ncbi:PREDICTED: cytosolic sulfotransferase 11-like [Tarenaya hassleriana]|uniref:cytosolic sulfotransferase 11-like n=1 Tax=Tarenaya hassleriana TaxID=28532 RepID=UPI00053C849F|nr:PREDICTED: cytosolic sulfotransferase 11-like [Tarenaya hassleriana]